jgi:hypothetical protein
VKSVDFAVISGLRNTLYSSHLSVIQLVGEVCCTLQQDSIRYQTKRFDDVETGL